MPPISPEQLKEILEQLPQRGVVLFFDEHNIEYAWVPVDAPQPHHEVYLFYSRSFKYWLRKYLATHHQLNANAKLIRRVIDSLESEFVSAPKYDLATRFAHEGTTIYLDLADVAWNTLEIDTQGWRIAENSRPRFRRFQHQLAIPTPTPGGDFKEIFDFLPLENPNDRLLILVWLVSAMNPAIPTPILMLTGTQGGGKSTLARLLRSLLDPSRINELGEIEKRNLVQVLQHHAIPSFDNLGKLNRREADFFCRAVTGGGIERRRLFTDSEEVIFSFRRAIIMNGIDLPSHRPDFLDRCIVLHLDRREQFGSSQDIQEKFESKRAKLLGSLLDLLSNALRIQQGTPQSGDFRMADFACFGRAVAIASGHDPLQFDHAYRLSIQEQSFKIVEDSSVAQAIRKFAKPNPFNGSLTELEKKLRATAKEAKISISSSSWPGSPRWLSTELKELAPALAQEGIVVEQGKRTNKLRSWIVYQRNNTL